jgi:small GTP-binding protein
MEDEDESYILGKERLSIKSKKEGQIMNRYTIVDQQFNEEPSEITDNSVNNSKKFDISNISKNSKDVKKGENNNKNHEKEKEKIKEKTKKKTINLKIILLGNVSVGKTSIVGRYIDNFFQDNYVCTIQAEQRSKIIDEDSNTSIRLDIWDTSGQEKFRSITRQYYRDCHGAILVFDLTNKKSFEQLPIWIEDIKSFGGKDTEIVILGNKSDLVEKREIPQNVINDFIDGEYSYFEVSAKNGNNISLAFDKLKKLIMEIINKNNEQNNKIQGKNKKGKHKKDNIEDYRGQSLDQISKDFNEKNKKCC